MEGFTSLMSLLLLFSICNGKYNDTNEHNENINVVEIVRNMLIERLNIQLNGTRKKPSKEIRSKAIKIWNNLNKEESTDISELTLTAEADANHVFRFNYKSNYSFISAILKISLNNIFEGQEIKLTRNKRRKPFFSVKVEDEMHTLYVDLLENLKKWNRKRQKHGFYTIKVHCGNKSDITCVTGKATIELKYKKQSRSRHRKNVGCKTSSSSRCCLHSKRVTMKELDLHDYIMAPTEFNFKYCKGSCTKEIPYEQIVKSYHTGSTCCKPTELTGLSILCLKGENVVRKRLSNIIAVNCKCLSF